EEKQFVDDAYTALRQAALKGGIDGLNDDSFSAPNDTIDDVLAIARTLPMMANRRFVGVKDIEKWEASRAGKAPKKTAKKKNSPGGAFERLCDYAAGSDPNCILVLVATKLDKRKKLYSKAQKGGWLVNCERPKRGELPRWIQERVKARGNKIGRQEADLIAELAGPELSSIADAVERLCLYVGDGNTIDEAAISECVVKLRTASVWELVGAVGRRDIGASLAALNDVFDPQDRGLSLLGILGWAMRQLIRYESARKEGMAAADAAKAAGAPPFKARELEQQLKKMPPGALIAWLRELKEADLDLKGGSKRPPRAILEQMVIQLCKAS
ncbi:MAG: DNA polymerase III subunit delta, partial [Polyangiaceae bacterium]|nr:DNA polymerase III subunit delta [Polyangiaceae bacterium]